MATALDRRREVAARWVAHRAAHRAAVSHLAHCPNCEWELCADGRRLWVEADERRALLPYDAAQIAREVEIEATAEEIEDMGQPASRLGLVVAFLVGAALMLAWPFCASYLGRFL